MTFHPSATFNTHLPLIFAVMAFVKSLKSDPLGIVDTRITMDGMKDSDMDTPFLPGFAPFTGPDESDETQPGSQTEAEASTTRVHRFLDFRESFLGLSSSQKGPRLELDVAADKHHTLDGLAEPLNPQNTPASNSEGESFKEFSELLRGHKTNNARTGTAPQSEEFNFDCFQDLPGASFVPQNDETEWPRSPNLRRLSTGHRQSFDLPATAQASHPPATNPSMLKESDDPDSVLRSVGFPPPVATPSPPSGAMSRLLLPIEERQDDAASKRGRKQFLKLLAHGPQRPRCACNGFGHIPDHDGNCKPSPTSQDRKKQSPKFLAFQSEPYQHACDTIKKFHIPQGRGERFTPFYSMRRNPYGFRFSASSSSPDREADHPRDPAGNGAGRDAPEVGAGNVADTLVANDSDLAENAKRKSLDFVAITVALYRVRRAPDSPLGSGSTCDLRLRIFQTYFPQRSSRNLPVALGYIPRRAFFDNLLFHACFIIPGLFVLMPTSFIIFAASFLADTRAGAVLRYLGMALLRLLKKIVNRVLAKCGVSFGFQCTSDIRRSDWVAMASVS
jgi:hypothetical protein